jgi:hypothetical protein
VSPILGALVVNLSGLIDHSQHTTAGLIASYVWFAAVAFLIWKESNTLLPVAASRGLAAAAVKRLGVLLALITIFNIPDSRTATLVGVAQTQRVDIGTRPVCAGKRPSLRSSRSSSPLPHVLRDRVSCSRMGMKAIANFAQRCRRDSYARLASGAREPLVARSIHTFSSNKSETRSCISSINAATPPRLHSNIERDISIRFSIAVPGLAGALFG